MLYALGAAATWGPSIYYATRVVGSLIGPSCLLKHLGTEFKNDVFSGIVKKIDNLKKNITFIKNKTPGFCAASGNNFLFASAVIFNEDFLSIDKDAQEFLFTHECSHIKNNDTVIKSLVSMLASAVSAFAVPFLTALLPWWIAPVAYTIPFLIGANVYYGFGKVREEKADDFAIEHATNAQLLGVERLLEVQIELQKELQPNNPQVFSEAGDNKFDVSHPKDTERFKKFKLVRQNRSIPARTLTSPEEKEKMQKIRDFFIKLYKNKLVVTTEVENKKYV